MPQIDLSILNQRQTPAFYADVLANRPAAGFIGRIFVSTNTFEFYRDNGTGWDLIGGPGAGTITGSGAAGQVSFWNGASTVTGDNGLFYDSVNDRLGIGTITPGAAIDAHSTQNIVLQLNQTTATNNTKIAFQNSGTALWRIGNNYGGGTNSFVITDAALNINRFSVLRTSGQTFVGDVVTSSGLFVVNSSSSDAHIVALGATAPSIRVRNAGTGASLQIGLGLATTTNNFIQGSTGGEFCIFNDSLTAQPILFGIKDAGSGNTLEAARISAARNFLVGTVTDAGQKFQVVGTTQLSGNTQVGLGSLRANLTINNGTGVSGVNDFYCLVLTGTNTISASVGSKQFIQFGSSSVVQSSKIGGICISNNFFETGLLFHTCSGGIDFEAARFTNNRNFLLNTTTDAGFRLDVNGTARVQGTLNLGNSGTNGVINSEGNRPLVLGGGQTLDVFQFVQINNGRFGTQGTNEQSFFNVNIGLLSGSGGDARGNVIRTLGTMIVNTAGLINTYNVLAVNTTINCTAGTQNTFRGFFHNPTLTNTTGLTHNAIETVTGNVCLGTTSGNTLIGTATSGASKLRVVGLPTSAAGLSSGDVWNNAGVLNIVP
jgi:hypothetical protein